MYFVSFAGVFFALFQFRVVSAVPTPGNLSLIASILAACMVMRWMGRNYRVSNLSEALAPLVDRYERLTGKSFLMRNAGEFGNVVGRGYAEASIEEGDLLGALIGGGIALVATLFGRARSEEERRLEREIRMCVENIESAESSYVTCIVLLPCLAVAMWLFSQYKLIPL